MSRVEDDRQAQRYLEQQQLLKQQNEAKTKDRLTQESAFAQKLQQSGGEKNVQQARQAVSSAYEQAIDDGKAEAQGAETQGTDGRESTGRQVLRQAAKAFQEKLGNARAGDGERMGESRLAAADAEAFTALGKAEDDASADRTSEGRSSDSKGTREELEKFGRKSGGQAGGAQASEGGGKTDADAGGGKGGGGGDKKDGGGAELQGGFRFNPALMAPVPVAKPRDTAGSERLRKIAQEIAQKIVERVRVGTNASGKVEFQIDLRSDVLKGLSIKVSGGNGRISASFSGSDREVLKLLDENKEALKQALSTRGLTLEDLRIEAKA